MLKSVSKWQIITILRSHSHHNHPHSTLFKHLKANPSTPYGQKIKCDQENRIKWSDSSLHIEYNLVECGKLWKLFLRTKQKPFPYAVWLCVRNKIIYVYCICSLMCAERSGYFTGWVGWYVRLLPHTLRRTCTLYSWRLACVKTNILTKGPLKSVCACYVSNPSVYLRRNYLIRDSVKNFNQFVRTDTNRYDIMQEGRRKIWGKLRAMTTMPSLSVKNNRRSALYLNFNQTEAGGMWSECLIIVSVFT